MQRIVRDAIGGVDPADQEPSAECGDTKKAQENLGSMALDRLQTKVSVTPTGFEQCENTGGKAGSGANVPLPVPPSLPIGTDELLSIWQSMSNEGRADLLAVARGLAKIDVTGGQRC
jgi:hypothetical protein